MTDVNRFRGTLLGVRIGDALGWPFEACPGGLIQEHTNCEGPKVFFGEHLRKAAHTKNLVAGDYTDDWQLTRAVAKSITQARGWNTEECIRQHLIEHERTVSGWGKSTMHALESIRLGERNGLFPPIHRDGRGAGNGVVMKIAPIALLASKSPSSAQASILVAMCKELGAITHSHPHAWISAYAIARIIAAIISNLHHNYYKQVREEITALEKIYVPNTPERTLASSFGDIINALVEKNVDEYLEARASSFLAVDTACIAVMTFLAYGSNPEFAMRKVILLGGDTDTNAAVLGSLLGARHGVAAFPEALRTFRADFAEAILLGDELFAIP